MKEVRVRFAPSPTGPLHIGGVRTALYNYLFAKKNGGKMILRIEDTDQTRFVPGAEDYIVKSLDWCGIKFDESDIVGGEYGPYRQSDRKPLYKQYSDELIEKGFAYYAFDTAEELDKYRAEAESQKKTFIYNAESRKTLRNSFYEIIPVCKAEHLHHACSADLVLSKGGCISKIREIPVESVVIEGHILRIIIFS